MYDALTTSFSLACPHRGETRVRLSAFRVLGRLPGPAHPAIFHVSFACACGEEHPALVPHDELDWAPLGLAVGGFVNLMTTRLDDAGVELGELAAQRIRAGEWPWSFFCHLEDRPRPAYPSSFVLLAPGDRSIGVAVRCPVCGTLSINLVTHDHVDLPFRNDRSIGVVGHVFPEDALRTADAFAAELDSARFDERRLEL